MSTVLWCLPSPHVRNPSSSPLGNTALQGFSKVFGVVGKKSKIFWCVVLLVAVNMMHNLLSQQVTTNLLFHHKSMLKHVFLSPVILTIALCFTPLILFNNHWMIWAINLNVPRLVYVATALPLWMPFTSTRPSSLALYPMFAADLVNRLCGYS